MENRISNLIKMENGTANIIHALQSKWGDSHWQASGGTYDGITWSEINEISKPTEIEFDTEVTKLQAAYDAQAYARNRVQEYPSSGDQWDMIYKDNLNSTTTHKDAVEAVKTKWPKDNSGPVE